LTMIKVVRNGKFCTSPPQPCRQGRGLLANDPDSHLEVFASRPLKGDITLRFELSDVQAPATIFHEVDVTAPRKAFTMTTGFLAAVHGAAAKPFGTGAVTFQGDGNPTSTTSNHCKTTNENTSYLSGSLTISFDSSGDKIMNSGTGLGTIVVKV